MSYFVPNTKRGYKLNEVVSALQKMIRSGNGRMALYWAVEMYDSNYAEYVWRRLLIISAEDVAGCVTKEVNALYEVWKRNKSKDRGEGRLFVAKAALLLATAPKSRDADNGICLGYEMRTISDAEALASIEESRGEVAEIPDEAYCYHTRQGRAKGRNVNQFIVDEQDRLQPKQRGIFDRDVELVRSSKVKYEKGGV